MPWLKSLGYRLGFCTDSRATCMRAVSCKPQQMARLLPALHACTHDTSIPGWSHLARPMPGGCEGGSQRMMVAGCSFVCPFVLIPLGSYLSGVARLSCGVVMVVVFPGGISCSNAAPTAAINASTVHPSKQQCMIGVVRCSSGQRRHCVSRLPASGWGVVRRKAPIHAVCNQCNMGRTAGRHYRFHPIRRRYLVHARLRCAVPSGRPITCTVPMCFANVVLHWRFLAPHQDLQAGRMCV